MLHDRDESALKRCRGGPALRTARRLAAAAAATAVTVALAAPAGAAPAHHRPGGQPDFGPNVTVLDPGTPKADIQAALDGVLRTQESAQFGTGRHAFLFKPGHYDVDAQLGYYTSVYGLGMSPDDVDVTGEVRVEGQRQPDGSYSALENFWRSAENLSVTPADGIDWWAVSQAAPLRRVHVRGGLFLFPRQGGYASGGYLADSKVDGTVVNASQQQWLTRGSSVGGWSNGVWNQVFSGVQGAPPQSFSTTPYDPPPYTTLDTSPVSREKPFLYVDSQDRYRVFVPAVRRDSSGPSWTGGTPAGSSLPIDRFFIAKPTDSAARINAELARGRDLVLTPGIYHLDRSLEVRRSGTVVLGLGYPTLVPEHGVVPMKVADTAGVKLSGLLFDAGPVTSPVLLQVGPRHSRHSDPADPTTVQDVYFRVGGAGPGRAATSLVVNSDDVLLDHVWAWRADHGTGVGWDVNTADTGVVVNGDDVTAYGLFVEHYQKYQLVWNGERGRTVFFQNEMPYDPPNQAAWSHDGVKGYAAYKVADSVKRHEAWGLGSYCYFNVDPTVHAARGFEVPDRPGVRLHDVLTVSLGGVGVIDHVVNDTGGPAQGADTRPSNVVSYP
ncbi:coagulation factor 5/8 type domain-containing protein [Streptomyces sp. NPDC001380]|uniref:coagulation factor 5/8 type domain-containing protein n=1 Tax=Streptomyces sp. NPDC001380 TaxID=3364566 RepID=UPI0036763B2C